MGRQRQVRSARRTVNRQSAQEIHIEALSKKCACGLDASTTIRTSVAASELIHKRPDMVQRIALFNGGSVPVFTVKGASGPEKHIRLGLLHVCQICRPAAEKEAAKGPSWVHTVIDSGPEVEPIIVGQK